MSKIKTIHLKITKPVALSNWPSEIMTSIPRILGGLMLTLNFGSDKFGMPWSPSHLKLGLFQVIDWFVEDVASYGGIFEMFPTFFAWMGAGSEAIGGLLLLLGFQTRIAGFLLTCTMLVAIFCQKWDQGLWGMLPAMGFLWIGIYAMVLGSGKLGLDYLISKSKKSNY